jgi:hypothetical protein
MVVTKKIFFILLIALCILLFVACSNSPLNQWFNVPLTDEQKTPDYAIQHNKDIDKSELAKGYKYIALGNYLFVKTIKEEYLAYKTNIGNYDFKLPFGTINSSLYYSNEQFAAVIDLTKINNQYAIDLGMISDNHESSQYTVYDTIGKVYSPLQFDKGYQISWVDVMDMIPDGYTLYVKMDGKTSEVLNKKTIHEKLG